MSVFAETCVTSNFSFLEGASHPEEYILRAATLGYAAISRTERHSFSSTVRGHTCAKDAAIRYLVGTRLFLLNQEHTASIEVLAYPQSKKAYGELCKLLTVGNLRACKNSTYIYVHDLAGLSNEIFFTIIFPRGCVYELSHPEKLDAAFFTLFEGFLECVKSPRRQLSMALSYTYTYQDKIRSQNIITLSERFSLALVATNDCLYHCPQRRVLQDIVTSIKHHTTVSEAGFLLTHNAERYLKPVEEIQRIFSSYQKALRRSLEITEACTFSLDELTYTYPKEIIPAEVAAVESPIEYLSRLTFTGAHDRYPVGISQKVIDILHDELRLIKELAYEHYFLTCYDIVTFARKSGILCQGRGAAANSAVCFCLGITAVDPSAIDLLFARFISKSRNEPPDIDIDFEHERREEVMQYIYNKYGRNRAGLVANVITYRERSAVRDVGKALGLSLETVDILAKLIHRWNRCTVSPEDITAAGLDPDNILIQLCLQCTDELVGFPRHLSQHVGGFIICDTPLDEIVPILHSGMESRTIIEWNKDDIELMGMLKIDILALGILTAIEKSIQYVNQTRIRQGQETIELHSIPSGNQKTYDMICQADTVGVFQIESRAQMSMLPRLKPRCFYDLVIEVAIVRPGPIHGGMVHPYLRRRAKKEPVFFPDEKIKAVLGKTLGVPIFQEQAMRLAIVAAEFTADEAEKLRRAMSAWKRNKEAIAAYRDRITKGMIRNGYSEEFAHSCFEQMKGFSEYGFPESHAASFALLVYASCWLKKYYPAHFTTALLNSQPMGFYSPSQLIRDATAHGVTVLPIDILKSDWFCEVFDDNSIRVGLCYVRGLSKEIGSALAYTIKTCGTPSSITELYGCAWALGFLIRRNALLAIARADGFASMQLSVREALWQIRALPKQVGDVDRFLDTAANATLKPHTKQQQMHFDYAHTGFSLKAHPIELIRTELTTRGVQTAAQIKQLRRKSKVSVAGIAVCRQRPGTAKGTVFITLEDEVGNTNTIIRPAIYEQFRRVITQSNALIVYGHIERTESVIHLIVETVESIDWMLGDIKKEALTNNSYSY